ncbi:MAG: hypothetical protein IT237_05500 [Bacteroidia bacterium]|nr:hypothetical protein [Bacteroidia bacterium]
MSETTEKFIEIVKSRSAENSKSIHLLFEKGIIGNCISILRQELDSFIRVIYLGKLGDMNERQRLMQLTIDGLEWNELTINGRQRKITDRDMVDFANVLFGYINYVYKFGCGFIHLSNNHDFQNENPFEKLSDYDKTSIVTYLNQYHNFPIENELTIEAFKPYLLNVYEKVSSNMLYHIDELKENRVLNF